MRRSAQTDALTVNTPLGEGRRIQILISKGTRETSTCRSSRVTTSEPETRRNLRYFSSAPVYTKPEAERVHLAGDTADTIGKLAGIGHNASSGGVASCERPAILLADP